MRSQPHHQHGDGGHHDGDGGEGENDAIFVPAAHFKVMMDGGHTEQTLAVGQFEVTDLHDDRQRLDDVNDTKGNDFVLNKYIK